MKTFSFFLACAFLCGGPQAFTQNQVVVNNTPGVKADYSSLQAAVNAVAPGSVILLQPGISSYGEVIIKNRVSIIGAGYFLGQNPAPSTQAALRSSVIDHIVFDTLSNGSYVTGLSITGLTTSGYNARVECIRTSNITVSRCLITQIVLPAPPSFYASCVRSLGIVFKQCYFQSITGVRSLITDQATGIEFRNNIFDGAGMILPVEANNNSYTAQILFQNNTMFNISNEGTYYSILTFINNLIFQQVGGASNIGAATALNNVSSVPFNVIGGINITNAVYTDVFVLNTNPSIASPDGQYQLKAGSPAKGYGQGGVDCGAFGGSPDDYYVLSGIAEFAPNIFFLNVPAAGATTGGLPVHIKVKANK